MAGPDQGQACPDKAGEHHAGPVDVGDVEGGTEHGQTGEYGQAGEQGSNHELDSKGRAKRPDNVIRRSYGFEWADRQWQWRCRGAPDKVKDAPAGYAIRQYFTRGAGTGYPA